MKLEIVSMVKVNGVDILQEDIPVEEFREMVEKKLDETMRNISFKRRKTA